MIIFDVCSSFSRQKRIDTNSLLSENYFFSWVPFTGAEVAQKWPIHCRTSFNFFQIEFKTSLKWVSFRENEKWRIYGTFYTKMGLVDFIL